MLLITKMRRNRLKNRSFPPAWEKVLERVPLYWRLPENDRKELKGLIQVFLNEKSFEGCGGFVMTDEARLTVAAQACILLLHRETDYFPGLSSIIIYPDEYLAPLQKVDESGVVTEWTDRLSGESCREGSIVISWKDVTLKGPDVHDAYNVVLHEFAHQLDAEDGITSGAPLPAKPSRRRTLAEALERGRLRLKHDLARARDTVLDSYGEENLEEFFAVATECFFERPLPLRNWDPELFLALSGYYRQNPAEWEEWK
jgi:Mlc titration factor MtfA (ptsG expression regulator)